MSSFAEVLARNRWKRTIHRLGSGIDLVAVILVLELVGIAVGWWLMEAYEPEAVLASDYGAMKEHQEQVRVEFDRLAVAKEEDLHIREAMTMLMVALPEQVKLKEITIGNFHNGDWLVTEAVSADNAALESYISTLRQNPGFEEMRIEDTNVGVKITVPMPEGFKWR